MQMLQDDYSLSPSCFSIPVKRTNRGLVLDPTSTRGDRILDLLSEIHAECVTNLTLIFFPLSESSFSEEEAKFVSTPATHADLSIKSYRVAPHQTMTLPGAQVTASEIKKENYLN